MQSGNLYAYCMGNPVRWVDPAGGAWETVLDVFGIVWSAADLITAPSWANAGFLLWDVGATLVPFVPGSYTAKGIKAGTKIASKAGDIINLGKAISKLDDVSDIVKLGKGFKSFKALKKIFRFTWKK